MTQEEIIEMTREAGWSGIYSSWTSPTNRTSLTVPVTMQQIEAFANLVAQEVRDRIMFGSRDDWVLAEREACAKVCDSFQARDVGMQPAECAGAIRARGDQA